MTQYFRITAYCASENLTIIIDSNGMYEKLWQFSSFFISKGFEILEISSSDKFLDGNISKCEVVPDNLILRETLTGRPENITHMHNGINYHAIKVREKIYIPDKTKTA